MKYDCDINQQWYIFETEYFDLTRFWNFTAVKDNLNIGKSFL